MRSIHNLFMSRKVLVILFSLSLCLFMGCSGDDDDDNDAATDYFPNAEGTQWSYDVTDYENNITYDQVTTITGISPFAGTICQVLIDISDAYPGYQARRYVVDTGSRILMYGFEEYDEAELIISHTFPAALVQFEYEYALGNTWTVANLIGISPSDWGPNLDDDLDHDGQDDTMDILYTAVIGDQGDISVPAGSFNTYVITFHMDITFHATSIGDVDLSGDISRAWVTPYVGVVKTEDYDLETGQITEKSELISYHLTS